ncbi:glycosyltransferase [Rhodococcus rhodnii]|uniref:Glycosyltransferase n=1 Tax=Rhodococcus rhodnii TaxID=38312 RepID=A0A6P2CJE4_9NOCA|nr:glycosyltransferase [Rhodococcus rhodnii]
MRGAVGAGSSLAVASAVVTAVNAVTAPVLRLGAAQGTVGEPVAVIVPARDEATRIAAVVGDLRRQRGVPDLRIVVVDDDSRDGTAALARGAAGDDERVSVVRLTEDPPGGWLGKQWACARGVAHAGAAGIVVFVDADVRLGPDAVARACAALRDRDAALVSPWPFQVAGSWGEQLMQPMLCWSWASTLPLVAAARSQRRSTVVAVGQFLVVDRAAYDAVGGHGAVAASPTEDLALARALRDAGGRTTVLWAGGDARCRMYDDARAAREGYSRWLWSAFGGGGGALAVSGLAALAYLVPPVALVTCRGPERRWAAAGTAAAVASRATARALERGRPHVADVAAGAAHPLAVVTALVLTARSHALRRRRRLEWKGRRTARE